MTDPDIRTTLVLGGTRSGKSARAQALAEAMPGEPVFVATAQAFDDEMRDRIARHRRDRDVRWRTIEAPIALAGAILSEAAPDRVLLVDCLTLWASNLLLADADAGLHAAHLVAAIGASRARLVIVSNEVGWGIVPDNPLARRFRDVAGRINQQVATAVDRVELVVAGLPMRLK